MSAAAEYRNRERARRERVAERRQARERKRVETGKDSRKTR